MINILLVLTLSLCVSSNEDYYQNQPTDYTNNKNILKTQNSYLSDALNSFLFFDRHEKPDAINSGEKNDPIEDKNENQDFSRGPSGSSGSSTGGTSYGKIDISIQYGTMPGNSQNSPSTPGGSYEDSRQKLNQNQNPNPNPNPNQYPNQNSDQNSNNNDVQPERNARFEDINDIPFYLTPKHLYNEMKQNYFKENNDYISLFPSSVVPPHYIPSSTAASGQKHYFQTATPNFEEEPQRIRTGKQALYVVPTMPTNTIASYKESIKTNSLFNPTSTMSSGSFIHKDNINHPAPMALHSYVLSSTPFVEIENNGNGAPIYLSQVAEASSVVPTIATFSTTQNGQNPYYNFKAITPRTNSENEMKYNQMFIESTPKLENLDPILTSGSSSIPIYYGNYFSTQNTMQRHRPTAPTITNNANRMVFANNQRKRESISSTRASLERIKLNKSNMDRLLHNEEDNYQSGIAQRPTTPLNVNLLGQFMSDRLYKYSQPPTSYSYTARNSYRPQYSHKSYQQPSPIPTVYRWSNPTYNKPTSSMYASSDEMYEPSQNTVTNNKNLQNQLKSDNSEETTIKNNVEYRSIITNTTKKADDIKPQLNAESFKKIENSFNEMQAKAYYFFLETAFKEFRRDLHCDIQRKNIHLSKDELFLFENVTVTNENIDDLILDFLTIYERYAEKLNSSRLMHHILMDVDRAKTYLNMKLNKFKTEIDIIKTAEQFLQKRKYYYIREKPAGIMNTLYEWIESLICAHDTKEEEKSEETIKSELIDAMKIERKYWLVTTKSKI